MQFVATDILTEVVRLSTGTCILGFLVGLAVFTTGWWKRAFWVAFVVTVGFGLYGLNVGKAQGTHPLAAALLLGLSAGLLALELGRLIAFATGGLATALAVQTFIPSFPEPFMAYLAGGLICVLLFKLWTMTVLSFAGSVLIIYTGLALAGRWAKVDVLQLANLKVGLLNGLVVITTAAGIVAQSRLDRFFTQFKSRRKDKVLASLSEKEKSQIGGEKKSSKSSIWKMFTPKKVA